MKEEEATMGAICGVCNGDMLKVDGCTPTLIIHNGRPYVRFTVGSLGDFYEDGDSTIQCTDCGAKRGRFHHLGCDCEYCPVCGGQLLSCDCELTYVQA